MTPTELAVALVRALNERDLDAGLAHFAPQAEVCFPRHAPRRVYRGGVELRELFDWFEEKLPHRTIAIDHMVATAQSVAVEFETAGRSHTEHEFDNVGVMIIDAHDGLISSVRVYLDTADLGRILGTAVA